jgi:hypothetical protein
MQKYFQIISGQITIGLITHNKVYPNRYGQFCRMNPANVAAAKVKLHTVSNH